MLGLAIALMLGVRSRLSPPAPRHRRRQQALWSRAESWLFLLLAPTLSILAALQPHARTGKRGGVITESQAQGMAVIMLLGAMLVAFLAVSRYASGIHGPSMEGSVSLAALVLLLAMAGMLMLGLL